MIRAIVLLLVSIALGSLGCAARHAPTPAAPVIVLMTECPAPTRPALPLINGALPFDHPENIEALLERDDVFRAYIQGLEAAIECYRAQAGSGQ
jgi:hypothetical protein